MHWKQLVSRKTNNNARFNDFSSKPNCELQLQSNLLNNSIPKNAQYAYNVLPGYSNYVTKRLKKLCRILTSREYDPAVNGVFSERKLDVRTGFPKWVGRGISLKTKSLKRNTT